MVIGCSLEAILFAYYNQFYYIPSTNFQPLFFEECAEFSIFGSKNKRQIYDQIKDFLGLLALNLEYEDVKQIRIENDSIKVFGDDLLSQYQFLTCYVIDSGNVIHENPIESVGQEVYKVVDDFKVSRMGKDAIAVPSVYSNDALLREIHFYNSLRVDGSRYVTDIITSSILGREQLYDFNYSDTIATFKLRKVLFDLGYIGLKQNHTYKSGKTKTKKLVLEHLNRYVLPIDSNTYANTANVKFVKPKLKGFLDGFSP